MPRPQFAPRHPPATPEEIKALRQAAGLSMPQAAKLIQVSAASWEAWEADRHRMPAPCWTLFKILAGRKIKSRDSPG